MYWTEKYKPKTLQEIKGQEEPLKKVVDFFTNKKRKKNALILHGPPGIGKTSIVEALAEETNKELFELNASDLRNKAKLQEILNPAVEQRSLLKQGKVILVDEVDGITGVDRGGVTELITIMQKSKYPIIITANDVWIQKLSPLRKKAEVVQLKPINATIIKDVLNDILKKENKTINETILNNIATRCKGDLRAAINDLHTIALLENPEIAELHERNLEQEIFTALKTVFKERPTNTLLSLYDNVDMPLDEIFLWIEENIPLEYQGTDLQRAYLALSLADVFKGRIYKQQYWRFLVYENILLSYGVSASKRDTKKGFTSYKKPSRILKIWINNQRIAKKKSIAEKYAHYVHIGMKRALSEFGAIKEILKNPSIQNELKLSEEEKNYLFTI